MARTVAILGFGVTGRAVANALTRDGDRVVVFDDDPSAKSMATGRDLGFTVEVPPAGSDLESRLASCDLVVPSPGVAPSHPIYAAAAAAGVPIRSEIEIAAERAVLRSGPMIVAITGTNGKTTVTTQVTAILQASGLSAVAAGNIGAPMIEAVDSGADIVVAEVSSFQLEYTEAFHPTVSCWLNLAPDHLDWHPTHRHYAEAKARIWANQTAGDTAVVNADDVAVSAAAAAIPAEVETFSFSARGPADYQVRGGRLTGPGGMDLMAISELPRGLPHDLSNALAAAAVSMAAGATVAGCRQGLARTAPLPHRVALVGARDGVSWYDDSKATTPASVLAAVAGFDSVVLIAGGRNKGLDLSALSAGVPPVHAVVAIGEAAADVDAAFRDLVPVERAESMEAAVEAAARSARDGDAILLSPGCASFDWYQSYAERGDHFASIVIDRLARGRQTC